jgi:hypothetical protein
MKMTLFILELVFKRAHVSYFFYYIIIKKMSMSTKIDDLPGPMDNELIDDLSQIQSDINQNPRQFDELVDQNQTNVKMNIKKRVHFKDQDEYQYQDEMEEDETDLFQYIKSQFSEENVLIFVILIMASRPEFDNYMTKLPLISNYILESSIMTSILKAIILLIVYILFKRYILSSIKM